MYPSNSLEVIFLIIGLSMGFFYGVGGFAASPVRASLKDSPRMKNFRWVLGGVLVSFLSGFARISDPEFHYSKLRVSAFYVAGFFAFAAVIITVLCFVIYFQSRSLIKESRDLRVAFTPVQDFLVGGHNFYRKNLDAVTTCLRERREEDGRNRLSHIQKIFLPNYIRQVTSSFAALARADQPLNDSTKRDFCRQILKSMCGILTVHTGVLEGLNVNYMTAISKNEIPPDFLSKLKFGFDDVGRYPYFLALKEYAFDSDGNEDFILPVEDDGNWDRVLPGAPEAFLRKQSKVVDNTLEISYGDLVPEHVKKGMANYFANKPFKSFASLVIPSKAGRPLGIVNIESSQECVFGKSQEQKDYAFTLLSPFCTMLAIVLK